MTGQSQWRAAAGWTVRRGREQLDRLGARIVAPPPGVPPRRLRTRVGAPGVEEYRAGGVAALEALGEALAPARFNGCRAVLDFGCGPGRVLTHLAGAAPQARLAGVDVDADAIAWGRAHLPGLELAPIAAHPPLAFPDADFDVIYSISVFSHLTAPDQDAWLTELARLLRPGGTALLSVHGASALEAFRSGAVSTAWCAPGSFDRPALGEDEFITVPYRPSRFNAGDLPGVGEGYGLSFHGPGYLREHWGRFLAVEAILPQAISGWQDLVVLRR